jgi:ribosome-binding protein aMBF1 (putative translation factor)
MEKKGYNMLFGDFVRLKRSKKGMSQSDLADLMSNNFQNISRLERGLITPTLYWVKNLADAFDLKLSDLIIEFEQFIKNQAKQKSK